LSEIVYNPSELAPLSKKIKSSSVHNPVPFCNIVQSLESSRLRASFRHATASTNKEEEEEEGEEGDAAGEPALYPSARWPTAETTTVLSAPYLYSMAL
jgi:hypothetical protein